MRVRIERGAAFVAVMLLLSTGSWAQPTLIERSLARIQAVPPSSPDSFEFIVFGDSNALEPGLIPPVFTGFLKEFNVLKPDLVVEVGDLILGGAAEGVPAQWDAWDKAIAALEPPYFVLPGNHDITDDATEKIWKDRIGPTHYSFEYGNSCFILLDSEEMGDDERISDAQVAWLKTQLESTKAANIFVFLHRPWFEHLGDPADAADAWDKRWANVAATFQGHPVRAVFAGHEHGYRDCGVRDGVRYVICAGAAVYGLGQGDEEGGFNHYLRVQVRGTEVSWAVIKPGAVLPQDAVTSDRINELYNVRRKWIAAEELQVPLGATAAGEQRITVSNPHDVAMKSTLRWDPAPGWTVSPDSTEFEVPAQGARELSFKVAASGAAETRYPVPVFKMRYEQTQFGPPVEVEQYLPLVPVLKATRSKSAIAIDGSLGEWNDTEFAPLIYPAQYEGKDPADLTSRMGFQWDDQCLYFAAETRDNEHHQPYAGDIVWSADAVEMFLGGWSYGLSLTKNGPEVFMYWGVDTAGQTLVPEVRVAVMREGDVTRYEAAFPKHLVAPLEMQPGQSFRFNALMNDLDPAGPEEGRHWLQLVPEHGTGGGAKPRVKVELVD